MNTLTGFLSAITNEFKSATGINLDTVHSAPLVSLIAEDLHKHGLIPATHTDIEESYAALTNSFPSEEDLVEVELFLSNRGWLAQASDQAA